jgi:DnaK suppressor protein
MKRQTKVSAGIAPRLARLAELRGSLEARRRELAANLHERMRTVRAGRGTLALRGDPDDGGVPEVDIQEDIELGLIQMKAETVTRIDEAIGRLDAGVYGYCASCGEEIAIARLRALPFAVRCRRCEEQDETDRQRLRADQRHAGFGASVSGR